MTTYYLGANRGQIENVGNISAGTVTNSTDMELRCDMTHNPTKKDLKMFIELLQLYVNGNGVGDGTPGTYLPPL